VSEQRSARTTRRRGEEEKTHKVRSFVSWLNAFGTVPLILLPSNSLRMYARKECEGGERGERANDDARGARMKRGAQRAGARTLGEERARRTRDPTHSWVSSVIWPTSIGMVPRIFSPPKSLRMCVRREE